jgi:MFS superfamily sulfate permease-like transporter
MSASVRDYQLAAAAAGFTLGFGFLTVWEAIQQTRRNRNPLRSIYIYMLWGEILVNLCISIVGWLFLVGTLGPTYVFALDLYDFC